MLLSSLEVSNFRSLEHVSIQGLSQFNVFIGRNNAGKSTILGALQFLASAVFRVGSVVESPDLTSILTARDISKTLSYRLAFHLTSQERREFIDAMTAAGYPQPQCEDAINSAFGRHISYRFAAPRGQPAQVRLLEVAIQTEDVRWFSVLKLTDENDMATSGYTATYFYHEDFLGQMKDLTLNEINRVLDGVGQIGIPSVLNDPEGQIGLPWLFRWIAMQIIR